MLCEFVFNWLQEKDYLIVNAVEYERETGFYYLNSRYYDAEIGRFVNSDALATTGQGALGCNMYAYCGNNPVRFSCTKFSHITCPVSCNPHLLCDASY